MTTEQETSNKEGGRRTRHGASLWLIGPLTILVAIIANLIVRAIAFALLPLSGGFLLLQPAAISIFTTIGVAAAVDVYTLVRRFARRFAQTCLVIAVIALLISCIPNIIMLINPAEAGVSGVTVPSVWVLISLHLVAGVVSVALLITLAPRRARSLASALASKNNV